MNEQDRRNRAHLGLSHSRPTRWRSVALVVALGVLLCACGNKGDLRLPEETPPAVDDSG